MSHTHDRGERFALQWANPKCRCWPWVPLRSRPQRASASVPTGYLQNSRLSPTARLSPPGVYLVLPGKQALCLWWGGNGRRRFCLPIPARAWISAENPRAPGWGLLWGGSTATRHKKRGAVPGGGIPGHPLLRRGAGRTGSPHRTHSYLFLFPATTR